MVKVIVFDAYGTLFDVQSVIPACESLFPGNGSIISRLWRQKQLDYTWLRALMKRYENFEKVNMDALRFTLNQLGKPSTDEIVQKLVEEYLYLSPYPEVTEVLSSLSNLRLAILSNGTQDMLETLVNHASLTPMFEQILSVNRLQTYKPDPSVYNFAITQLSVEKDEVLFVSSNGWDVAGAKSFGFTVAWVNRAAKELEELGEGPDFIVSDLEELLPIVEQESSR